MIFNSKEDWNRIFEVPNSITLEHLNSIIQTILDWDEAHLYTFQIKNNHYAFMGNDFPCILGFTKHKYLSCDIKLYELKLRINDEIFYDYDFGDKHKFKLQILEISDTDSPNQPKLISFQGYNIEQYPDISSNIFFELNNDSISKRLFNEIDYFDWAKEYRHIIRFIHIDDYKTLQKWRNSKDKIKWEKAVVILENWEKNLQTISEKIERPVKKIKEWIVIFNAFGLNGITQGRKKRNDKKRTGIVEKKKKRILKIFHNKPTEYGINRSNWTLDSLAKAYESIYRENISSSSVGVYLKKLGFRIKKARNFLTSPDPNYQEKVESLLNILWSLKKNEELFFIDELGPLRIKKYGGRSYSKKGDSVTIPQNQPSKGSITLFAALSALTNQVTWGYGKSKDTTSMIDLIEILYNQYYDKSTLFITWDAASWHSSNELLNWLDNFNMDTKLKLEGPVVELIPLPSSSQFLNVIESVFSGMKRAVIHHSNYQNEIEMKQMISKHFEERNEYFKNNPKRAGNKIWDIDFFKDYDNIKSGNYREW